MAKSRGDYTDVLIKKKIVSPEQIEEAQQYANSVGIKLQDALAKQNYATPNEITGYTLAYLRMSCWVVSA